MLFISQHTCSECISVLVFADVSNKYYAPRCRTCANESFSSVPPGPFPPILPPLSPSSPVPSLTPFFPPLHLSLFPSSPPPLSPFFCYSRKTQYPHNLGTLLCPAAMGYRSDMSTSVCKRVVKAHPGERSMQAVCCEGADVPEPQKPRRLQRNASEPPELQRHILKPLPKPRI